MKQSSLFSPQPISSCENNQIIREKSDGAILNYFLPSFGSNKPSHVQQGYPMDTDQNYEVVEIQMQGNLCAQPSSKAQKVSVTTSTPTTQPQLPVNC